MLEDESKAFDKISVERAAAGHIPDIQHPKACDWFYNNPWRRPYLVDMVFGKQFAFALEHIASKGTVLEIGCGTGHMCLEFARCGYNATGVDVSAFSVQKAAEYVKTQTIRGKCDYIHADFLNWECDDESFDSIVFFGSLHHFENPKQVLEKANNLLTPSGRIIVIEPSRDEMTLKDAAIITLMRTLLNAGGMWFKDLPTPITPENFKTQIKQCFNEFTDAIDDEGVSQSPHDNACSSSQMFIVLNKIFKQTDYAPGFAFFSRIGGGLRGKSEIKTQVLAEFLKMFDEFVVETGLMNPLGFFWAGRKK